jgi:hypothetical protein
VVGEAEHAGKALLGNLHEIAGLLIDRHGLAWHAIRAEDEPLAIGGPLVVGLVDLGIAGGGGGEKRERHTGDGIDDDLLFGRESRADLGGCGNNGEERAGQQSERAERSG